MLEYFINFHRLFFCIWISLWIVRHVRARFINRYKTSAYLRFRMQCSHASQPHEETASGNNTEVLRLFFWVNVYLENYADLWFSSFPFSVLLQTTVLHQPWHCLLVRFIELWLFLRGNFSSLQCHVSLNDGRQRILFVGLSWNQIFGLWSEWVRKQSSFLPKLRWWEGSHVHHASKGMLNFIVPSCEE